VFLFCDLNRDRKELAQQILAYTFELFGQSAQISPASQWIRTFSSNEIVVAVRRAWWRGEPALDHANFSHSCQRSKPR
jgi:hypothetical protein